MAFYGIFFASLPERVGQYLYSEIAVKNEDLLDLRNTKQSLDNEIYKLRAERDALSLENEGNAQKSHLLGQELAAIELQIRKSQNRLAELLERENRRTANIILRDIRNSFRTLIDTDASTGMPYRVEGDKDVIAFLLRYNDDAKCAASSHKFQLSLEGENYQHLINVIENTPRRKLGYDNHNGAFLGSRIWYDAINPWIEELESEYVGLCYNYLKYETPESIAELPDTIIERIQKRGRSRAGKRIFANKMMEPAILRLDLSQQPTGVRDLVESKISELRAHEHYSTSLTNFLENETPNIDQVVAEGRRADMAYQSMVDYLDNNFLYSVPDFEYGTFSPTNDSSGRL